MFSNTIFYLNKKWNWETKLGNWLVWRKKKERIFQKWFWLYYCGLFKNPQLSNFFCWFLNNKTKQKKNWRTFLLNCFVKNISMKRQNIWKTCRFLVFSLRLKIGNVLKNKRFASLWKKRTVVVCLPCVTIVRPLPLFPQNSYFFVINLWTLCKDKKLKNGVAL